MMDRSLVLSEITGASTVALQPSCDPSRASGPGLRRPGTAAPAASRMLRIPAGSPPATL